jgi:hypothetical protein
MATLFACSTDSMNTEESALSKKSKDKTKSFKVVNLEGNYAFSGDASCPTILLAEGQGTVPHLGLSALSETWCYNGNPNNLGTRTITFTAANGDELYGYHTTIDFDGQNARFTETLVIYDGSGRFKNACGTFTENVEISNPAGPGTFILNIEEGTLTFTGDCKDDIDGYR